MTKPGPALLSDLTCFHELLALLSSFYLYLCPGLLYFEKEKQGGVKAAIERAGAEGKGRVSVQHEVGKQPVREQSLKTSGVDCV